MKYSKNKYALLVAAFAFLIILFSSCEKEGISEITPITENQEVIRADWDNMYTGKSDQSVDLKKQGKCDYSTISVVGGRLSFVDMDHFKNTLACLEQELEAHHQKFDNQYSSYPPDQWDDIADNIGFEDWKPLTDFEQFLNFSSRRAYIENAIVGWLNNPNPDWNNDPDDLDGLSEELRTLLNFQGGVKIGGQLYNFIPANEDYAIVSGQGGQQATVAAPDSCYRFRRRKIFGYYAPERRYKLVALTYSYPWKIKAKAKIVHYKFRGSPFNRWKRSRSVMTLQMQGLVRDEACNAPLSYNLFRGPENRKKLKVKFVAWWPPSWAKFKVEETAASCSVENGTYVGLLNY